MQVVVTRPQGDASKLVDALSAKGFEVTALPLIEVAGPPEAQAVQQSWVGLPAYDAVMFVSGNAVQQFFAARPQNSPFFADQSPVPVRAWVTGPGSLTALQRCGVGAPWIDGPDPQGSQFDSEALWAVVSHKVTQGFRLLIVRGADGDNGPNGDGRDWLGKQVRKAGGRVDYLVAYQRLLPSWAPAQTALAEQVTASNAVWIFSSSQAIRNLRALMPKQDWSGARAVVTHARIAQTAKDLGFGNVLLGSPSIHSLVASIESLQ